MYLRRISTYKNGICTEKNAISAEKEMRFLRTEKNAICTEKSANDLRRKKYDCIHSKVLEKQENILD